MSIVRALTPGAQAIDVVAREDSSLLGRLELAHPGGLFAGPVVGGRPYRLRILLPNAVQETGGRPKSRRYSRFDRKSAVNEWRAC